MAEIRLRKLEKRPTRVRNVPIALTPEGFWCCPSPVVFQKNVKAPNPLNKPKPSSPPPLEATAQKKKIPLTEKKPTLAPSRSRVKTDGQHILNPDSIEIPTVGTSVVSERLPKPKIETVPRKFSIEFGEPGTSDMKVLLLGKHGFFVKLIVHRKVLMEYSSYFANKLSQQQAGLTCLEIDDCEDVEIYVETVGLMYCKDLKQRLIKQNVSRVLRIVKVAELLGFNSCMLSCLEYLEAVPWVGEEEEKVVSLALRLQGEGIGVNPVLKRVSSNIFKPPKETLIQIIELILKSNEERSRREMKSVVLKLLKENNGLPASVDICKETIYGSCQNCLNSLLSQFKQAAEPEFADKPMEIREPVVKQIALESDNLLWLVEILAESQAADEFAVTWANQQELAVLHTKLPIVSRYHISCITARLCVGIGRGQLLPLKNTRQLLLQTWLQPLINDYNWLQNGCRSFDWKVVEEGIGRTILTLPLEDQQSILLSWLGNFLKAGDSSPNLQRAFEVWWRRTFVRSYADEQGNLLNSDT